MSREVSPLNTHANSASATRLVRPSWTAWEVRSGCPTRNRFKAFSKEKTAGPSKPLRGQVAGSLAFQAFQGTSEP
jgi:hypothetical protein